MAPIVVGVLGFAHTVYPNLSKCRDQQRRVTGALQSRHALSLQGSAHQPCLRHYHGDREGTHAVQVGQ
eukprot:3103945-Amphidinium_carterae.1